VFKSLLVYIIFLQKFYQYFLGNVNKVFNLLTLVKIIFG